MIATSNPFFSERADFLAQMQRALAQDHIVAISGPAGIGKTELVHAYVGKYADTYHPILWLNAATCATLLATFLAQPQQIELSIPRIQTRPPLIQALRNWLTARHGYLLILDNADDPSLVQALFPARPAGHLLLLTEQQVAERSTCFLFPGPLSQMESARLLLARAGQIPPTASLAQADPEQRVTALELAGEIGGLPLALELVAADIKETGSTIQEYLQRYHRSLSAEEKQAVPLERAWRLSSADIHVANPSATDSLRTCSLLAPDDIPLELLLNDAQELETGSVPTVADEKGNRENERTRELLFAYVLCKPGTLPLTANLHRSVQNMLLNTISQDERDTRIAWLLQALYRRLPPLGKETQRACLRYVPHVQRLAELVELEVVLSEEAAQVFAWAASVLAELSVYQEAFSLLGKALAIWQRLLGEEHPTTIMALHNLASLYEKQGLYAEAEELFRQVLTLRARIWGEDHVETAISLNNLAYVYTTQKKHAEAEALYQKALHICSSTLGPESPATVPVLYNLAELYAEQGKLPLAETSLDGAYSIRKHMLGPEHLATAKILHRLALIYILQGKWTAAETAYRKVLPIYQRDLGWADQDTTSAYMEMANLFLLLDKLQQAEDMQRQLLEMRGQALGQGHPDTLASMNALASVYLAQRNYQQAKDLLHQALAISKETLGSEYLTTASIWSQLALIHEFQGEHEQAVPLFKKAYTIWEKTTGEEHPLVRTFRQQYPEWIEAFRQ